MLTTIKNKPTYKLTQDFNPSLNQNLQKELQNFGLDPREWTLIKERSHTYKIANTKDSGFTFKGQTKLSQKKLTWDFIHLSSI